MKRLLIVISALLVAVPALAADPYGEHSTGANSNLTLFEVEAGAGIGGFTSTLGYQSSVGVGWDARLGMNGWRYFGAELAYLGTSNATDHIPTATGTLPSTRATENQVSADLKLAYPVQGGDHILRPYGIAGAGYAHVGVDSSLAPVGLTNRSEAVFPFGVGLSYNVTRAFLIDGRYTYNVLTGSGGNNWNVAFNLGATFGS